MDLNKLRIEIDDIDNQLLELLNHRAQIALRVGQWKRDSKNEMYAPSREQLILERLQSQSRGPFPKDGIRRVFREIISASLSLEQRMRVAYLGPQATFTYSAAMELFGHSAELHPAKSIRAVFDDVAAGRSKYGVVPVENSNEGAVTHTLDMFLESSLMIIAERYLEISHDLLSKPGELGKIRAIYSHPLAFEQCKLWLDEHMHGVPCVSVPSTARAAQMASEEATSAAVACSDAAHLYGLKTVETRIQDYRDNFTRFLVISQPQVQKATGNDRTSILFRVKDQPGALSLMLEPFRNRKQNLMKIESRPVKSKAWDYVFYLDVEGHADEADLAESIEELRELCTVVRVLGSYARAR